MSYDRIMRVLSILTFALYLQAALAGEPTPNARQSEMQKALEEFRIQTRNLGLRPDSPPSAQVRRGPAVKYHGRLYENFRNDILDAVPHEIRQRDQSKSLLRRNQFGFNVGGPVVIPRLFNGARTTFFSVSWEGVRERISRSYLRTVPTSPERSGDFSSTVDLSGDALPIYDPATTRPNPAYNPAEDVSAENLQYLRDPFPVNRIPVNRLDATAQAALKLYPQPNASAGPFFRNNYFAVSPETNTASGMILRLDHSVTSNHRLEFFTSFSNGLAGSASIFPTAADPAPADRSYSSRHGNVKHTWTISPGATQSLRFDATTDGTRAESEPMPVYRFSPYTQLGRDNGNYRTVRNNFTVSYGVTRRSGQHSIAFTADWQQQQLNAFSDYAPEGAFSFGSGLTSLPGIVNTGHGFASYLLGMPQQVERSVVTSPSYFRRSRTSLAMSDKWEVRQDLTFSGSLNFEIATPRVEKFDRQSTVDLATGAMIVAGMDGIGRGFQPVRHNFEPSAGFAWNPLGSTSTVIRSSFSLSVGSIGLTGGQFATQAFNAYPTQISSNAQLEPVLNLSDGLPAPPALPDLRPDALHGIVADLVDRTDRQPTVEQINFSVEREMPQSILLTAGYYRQDGDNWLVGNTGVNVNAIPLDALAYRDQLNDEPFRRSLRPWPQYLGFDINGQYPAGRYIRDAGYLRVEKRTSGGLGLSAYYEWGKQLDDYSGPWGVQDAYNRDNEWARTVGVNPMKLTLSYNYDLPIGPGKLLLPWSDWRRYLSEGWSLSGMTTLNTGDPLYLRPQFNNTGGVIDSLRVDVVPGVDPRVSSPGPDLWFNPNAFVQPADFTAGNASRTHPYLLQPGSQNHDLSVTKRFMLNADRMVELSAAGFNFVNHANWNDPDVVIGSASSPNVNAGRIIGSTGGRVVQLGLRYSF